MGKSKNPRRVADNEAVATATMLRGSPQKLNLVAAAIRGLPVEQALTQLAFNRRGPARDVKKVLESAVANAENNHDLDVDNLVVSEASVGKSLTMKRFRARARGRAAQIQKPFSRLRIVVREVEEQA
ncbi:LSU ribosomal protein L22P [Rhodothalassium salexigens DSM 2132]|uniref:Large ribosomal subunit protein uL22 n=1 Tax=Rhodothalassium salexigens DSM 2132 TaxID=1188247 RepID=A0A4R2PAI2_RHOSA|nr:50S ribosomal protein L22 [Rhodothalassium salexigens DSM 2132]TCP31982.1 LSU ribosomal protein L22P [Rhodothalassium salexigens DSM 2132]